MVARKCQQRWEDVRELGLDVVVERREPFRVQAFHVLVERIHEDGERQVPLELRCRPEEDEVAAFFRASGEFLEQPCLADPGLADELDRDGAPPIELGQDPIERTELLGAPDEVIAQGHLAPLGPA
jgi:hypothetical protein